MKPLIPYKLIKQQTTLIKVILFYLAFYVVSSPALFWFEHKPAKNDTGELKRNEKGELVYECRCKDLLDAFWINTVFLFTGFEDFGPKSPQGKIISFLSFSLGLATVTLITGKIASKFVLKGLKERKMRKDLSGHITICNWHDGGEKIIKEIHAPQAEPDIEIVVLTQSEVNEEELRHSPEFEKVFFMRCDPTLHNGLKASRISEARSVIILADPKAPDPDAVSAMIGLAVTRLCSTAQKPHIVAEAVNHRKIEHLIDAGVDEIICASDYEYGIIAQCAMLGKFGKLSQVYHDLLTFSDDTNEFYIVPPEKVPRTLQGKTFSDACATFLKTRETKNPLILVGLVRNGEAILNPKHGHTDSQRLWVDQVQESDGLIIMAYDHPDLSILATP